jgi:hypothetical protein
MFDITPRLDDDQLKRTVNRGLGSLWLTESALSDVITRLDHLPAARRLAALLGLPGTPTRSGWEDEFPEFCATHDLPPPIMGAQICGYTVDAVFPAHKVIVELDSWEFHKNRIAFETDRERDAETLAHGFITVRITWQRIHEAPAREAARLQAILAQRAPLWLLLRPCCTARSSGQPGSGSGSVACSRSTRSTSTSPPASWWW